MKPGLMKKPVLKRNDGVNQPRSSGIRSLEPGRIIYNIPSAGPRSATEEQLSNPTVGRRLLVEVVNDCGWLKVRRGQESPGGRIKALEQARGDLESGMVFFGDGYEIHQKGQFHRRRQFEHLNLAG